ncbi:MAG: hypothetical protein NVS4B7_05270 [Ktedonobacteraceae bacterium]
MSLADNPQNISEDQTLQNFGYRQEYKRELKRFASFAVGFSFISMSAHTVHLLRLYLCRRWYLLPVVSVTGDCYYLPQ